jgi:polyisoprenoid-binding protein YceI
VVVAAGSGNSGDKGRDKAMNKDVLDVTHFAEVSFVPKSFQGAIAASGDSTVQVTGTFTLHGTPHELTVPMQLHIDGTNLTAKTHFMVPYVQWGLKDPSIFIAKVAKEVGIDLTLVGSLSPAN